MTTTSLHEKASERFIGAGIGFGLLFMLGGCAAAGHLPFLASWLLESVIFISGFAGVTRWKRNPWGWVWTGYVTAVCVAGFAAYFAGVNAGGAFVVAGCLIAVGWLCVLRLERHRQADPVAAQHIVNHHVFHGLPAGVHLPDMAMPSEVIRQVPDLTGVTPHRQPLAITAPRALASFRQRLADKVHVWS